MKKILAVLLALAMVFCFAACGGNNNSGNGGGNENNDPVHYDKADDVPDTMTSEDGKYEIAFITDVGQLKDKSFNQGTYDGCKLYAANNGKSYKYYQPANGDQATDDDRYDAMKAAVDGGAKVIVCAGFMQGTALEKAAKEFTDVNFIFIDGWSMGLANVSGVAFKEEQCGYFAGYAVVKEGYEKLGFCGGGGGTNPACMRYGYGFAQGASDAAKELNKTVELNYTWLYGANFAASTELQTLVDGWYSNGTEVVFSCGGSIFQSITAAAAANEGAVIGVDSDQSFDSPTVITSALKGVGEAAALAIGKVYDGTFAEIAGANMANLGAAEGSTGLPTATWSLKNYTVAEYEAQLKAVVDGTLVIDNNAPEYPESTANLTVNPVK